MANKPLRSPLPALIFPQQEYRVPISEFLAIKSGFCSEISVNSAA